MVSQKADIPSRHVCDIKAYRKIVFCSKHRIVGRNITGIRLNNQQFNNQIMPSLTSLQTLSLLSHPTYVSSKSLIWTILL